MPIKPATAESPAIIELTEQDKAKIAEIAKIGPIFFLKATIPSNMTSSTTCQEECPTKGPSDSTE